MPIIDSVFCTDRKLLYMALQLGSPWQCRELPQPPNVTAPQTLELYTPMHTHTRRPLGPPLTKHSSTHIASARAEQELNSSFGAEHSTRLFCAQDNLTRVSWVIYQYISPRSSPRHAHLCATPHEGKKLTIRTVADSCGRFDLEILLSCNYIGAC